MSIIDDKATYISDLKMADEEDSMFQTFANNSTSSPMNSEDQQCIQQIKIDLMNSCKVNTSSSNFISNNLSQKNIGDTNNMEKQQQFELMNGDNNWFTNSNLSDMDVDDGFKKSEQIYLNVDTTTNDGQHFDGIAEDNNNTLDTIQHDQTSLPLTTDKTYAGEKQMNAFEYVCQCLEKLTLAVNTLKPELTKLAISTKIGDVYLKSLPIPSPNEVNITAQEPLNTLSNLFQRIHLFPSFRPICNIDNVNHTDPVGEELNESSEKVISGPSEDNGSLLNQEIQASTQSKISMACTPNDSSSLVSLNLLSQLLLKPLLESFEGKKLITIKFICRLKHLWHARYIADLATENGCPPLASEKQRQYMIIELSNLMDYNLNDLFAFVQLLTYDGKPHPSKVIVPPETKVKSEKLEDLDINDAYGWNLSTNTILYPYKTIKYPKGGDHQLQLKVLMFNKYQDKKFHGSYHTQDSTANDKVVKNHQRDFIENEKNKIFKLRIGICQRTLAGQLECVSEIKDTDLIKESQATEELEIDKNKIILEKPCKCGKERLIVPLNDYSEKAGFIVKINGIQLASHEFIGGNRLTIEIKPPPQTPDITEFHLFIGKINVFETMMQNFDPFILDPLLDAKIKYADHRGNDCHHCIRNKERKRKHKE